MRQAGARFAACRASSGAPPRPPLGVSGPFVQVSAPASTPTGTPLRTADTKGPVTAVEVELTLKAADRLRDIVRDLTLDHEAVLYVVGTATIGRAVETAATTCGSRGQVHIVDLARMAVDHD